MTFSRRGLLVCALLGVAISALPHFVAWLSNGSFFWISDLDELELYWPLACNSYWNHWYYFSDPLFEADLPSTYPAIQIFHGTWLSKWLGLGPQSIGFFWRVIAGATVGAAWYCIFSAFRLSIPLAFAATLIFLSDTGLVHGKLFWTQISNVFRVLSGADPHFVHSEWRLITPALSWPFLLFYIFTMKRALDKPERRPILIAGFCLGLLVWSYFYFWTMAFAGLALAFVVDNTRRRTYFQVGVVGAIVGAPSILKDALLKLNKSSDWLERSDKFVPIERWSELILAKSTIFVLIVTGFLVWRRRRDLLWLWALAVAGFALMNHQVVTGLQIENFHWYYGLGPVLWLLFAVLLLPYVESFRRMASVAVVLGVVYFGFGLWLRYEEAVRSSTSVAIMKTASEFAGGPNQLEPKGAVAGDSIDVSLLSCFANVRPLYSASVLLSANVKHEEFFERHALNSWLRGESTESYRERVVGMVGYNFWGPWYRDPSKRASLESAMLETYDRIVQEPEKFLALYSVRHVISETSPPGQWTPSIYGTRKIWTRNGQ